MKINPYLAKNTDSDISVFSSMITTYLEHALSNNTPGSELRRGVREILSMMYRIMPAEQKYIQYISTQYWTKKALEFANFNLPTPGRILNDINNQVRAEVIENNLVINNPRSLNGLVLEHAVPARILQKNILNIFNNSNNKVIDISTYIKDNFIFVTCTKIEDKLMSNAGYQYTMPNENDKWSRYKATNIEVFDTETGYQIA